MGRPERGRKRSRERDGCHGMHACVGHPYQRQSGGVDECFPIGLGAFLTRGLYSCAKETSLIFAFDGNLTVLLSDLVYGSVSGALDGYSHGHV